MSNAQMTLFNRRIFNDAVQKLKSILTTRLDYGLLAALVIPMLACMPLLTHAGLPNTADGPVHLMRQVELNQAWAEGNFYPRWGTDLALGHGMPIFSYAPPFLYQLTQLIHLTGLPLDESMKGVIIFDFLLYSLGMFLFARRIFGPYPALLAAGVYVYTPYRLREAYIQGNYGQFSGLAFYPLILWAFHGLITEGRPRYLIAAAISLAGLLFSHNISFMLFVPLLAAYLVFLLCLQSYLNLSHSPDLNTQYPLPSPPSHSKLFNDSRDFSPAGRNDRLDKFFPWTTLRFTFYVLRTLLPRTLAAGLLGLGLAAIFWLPAFGERHDIKLEGITQGFFDFRENFISLPELFSPPRPLDLTAMNPEFPLSLGLPQIISAAAGILALLILTFNLFNISQDSGSTTHNSRFTFYVLSFTSYGSRPPLHPSSFTHTLFFTLFLLLYAFLTLPYSQFIWENVPLVELAEFPWRMLGPAILCAAVLSAAALSIIIPPAKASTPPLEIASTPSLEGERTRLFITLSLLFLVIALNAHYLYPSQFIVWGTPTPAEAFAYEAASGAIGTTSTGEFLPRWAQQHPEAETLWPDYEAGRPPRKLDPAGLPQDAAVEYLRHQAEADWLEIDTPEPFVATLRTLYWPGWQLYLDDQPVAFTITEPAGLIQVTVPAGRHTLKLQLEPTPLRTTGLWLTLLSSALLAAIILHTGLKKFTKRSQSSSQPLYVLDTTHYALRTTHYALRTTPHLFTITTLSLLALYLLSRPLAPLFVLSSHPDQPQPADQILQVDFADQLRLVGLDDLPELIQLPKEGSADLTAVLYWRALQPTDHNYTVFLHLDGPNGQTFATVDEVNPENIPTRNWPPGLYLRHLLQLKIPNDLPPIRYDLTTGVYRRETGQRLATGPDRATSYRLGSIWLVPASSPPLQPAQASFGAHVTLHGATLNGNTLTLLWQTDQALDQNYSIFVHILNSNGSLISQADGVPYDGLYPLPNWRPGQLISDTRLLDLDSQAAAAAVGLYDPVIGQRLPAYDADGQPLPEDRFILNVTP